MKATKPSDDLSSYYADLLEGACDCVDRIVVNACFALGQTGGGLRSWWRVWKGGEKTLSDAGMKTVAGDFARRLRAWCQKQGIPFLECQSGEQKHVLAESLPPKDPKFRGVFAVLTGRAPAPVWQVQCNQRGQIVNLRHRDPWPHVQHFGARVAGGVRALALQGRRYQSQPRHLRALCGYVLLGEQVIKPLLAGAAKTPLDEPPRQLSPIDQQYIVLREHRTQTFELLGLAA
jgi:hypothetical protein